MATIPADLTTDPTRPIRTFVGPRFRRDVEVFPDEHDGYFLRDSRAGREFQVGRWECLVVRLLDGTRQPNDVCRDLTVHGIRCDRRVLDGFIAKLQRAGLLADGGDDDVQLLRIERRGLLYMVRLLRPDKWARWTTARLRWLCHPLTLLVIASLIASAIIIAATSVGAIGAQLASTGTTRAAVFALGLAVVAAVVHEASHAIAASWYGAHLVSAGFGIYYFRPCLFCEIRGLESLARSKRLAISGAGLAADLVQASICLVCWRLFSTGMVARTALLTAFLLGVRVLINLNPLLKLDGYYLLVDLIGRRDLRESAFRTLARALRDLPSTLQGRGPSAPNGLRPEEIAYGLLAVAYIGALTVAAVITLERWLRTAAQGVDVIIAVLVVSALASLTDRALWGGSRPPRGRL